MSICVPHHARNKVVAEMEDEGHVFIREELTVMPGDEVWVYLWFHRNLAAKEND